MVKVNRYADRRALGSTAKAPRWAVAYKFKAEQALTELLSVDFQVGRTGAVTPVANLAPVQLAGTTVKRATLHNAEQIAQLDIRLGDRVYVEKGGEIIPKITGVDFAQRKADSRPFEYITVCPVCGTPLVRYEGEAKYYCPNQNHCEPQILGRIIHFIRRKAMDIDGLGEETVELLYRNGWCTTPPTSTTCGPDRSPLCPAWARNRPRTSWRASAVRSWCPFRACSSHWASVS